VDMGGFYLDIIKDRQYTTPRDSLARRSAQSALYHIVEALTRWLAPILSFTAEEIWQAMPGRREESVFLATWYEHLDALDEGELDAAFWERAIGVRDAVGKELENLRAADKLGGSLEAEVDIYCAEPLRSTLRKLEDELRFVLITSYARLHPLEARPDDAVAAKLADGGSVYIRAARSEHAKCVRCWHRREDVGAHAEHPQLCGRCVSNVQGPGEVRRYA
jgi:isoleucyl-tRNA synthetase